MTQIAPTYGAEITVSHGDTFLVTERSGQVREGRAGLYHRDVRYLDTYHFTISGAEPVLLTATNTDFHRSLSFFTNPLIGGYRTELAAGLLLLEALGARVHLRARERSFEVVRVEGDVEVTGAAR